MFRKKFFHSVKILSFLEYIHNTKQNIFIIELLGKKIMANSLTHMPNVHMAPLVYGLC